MIVEALQFLATLCGALFCGAALYINVAEHPARMRLEPHFALKQWAPSYARATLLQAPLALVSFVSGTCVWLLSGSPEWLVGAILVGAVVPFTFGVIMPTNKRLLASDSRTDGAAIEHLLQRWTRLHAIRTVLSFLGTVVYLRELIWR